MTDIALPTHDEARALTNRIKIAVEGTWQLIREAYTSRTWAVLGYDTWDAYCTVEFGETRLKLPREERQEVVASLRESGMSYPAISAATGISVGTAHATVQAFKTESLPHRTQGTDGKTYAARADEVIDAEIVDEPARPEPSKAKRRPLPEAFTDAGRDLTRAADRLARLTEDDRFAKNRETTHHQVPELLGALEHTAHLIQAMHLQTAGASAEARRWWATSLHKISDALTGVANSIDGPHVSLSSVPAQTSIPEVDIVTVTPALAAKWLKQNTHNRNLRPRAVADYARDMAAGKWRQNGEAIKFAADGTLLDGQHRLSAVVEAGVPVAMLIVSGLEADTQETMDAGRKRSAADAFSLRGETNSTILASVLRRVWMWERGDYRFAGNIKPTTAECADMLHQHPEIRRSVEIAARVHQTFKYLPQSITGTAHWVLSGIDQADAVWFFARLGDGAELSIGHPILTLRTRVMAEAADRHQATPDRQMAYLIRAWNAHRTGKQLARIQQAPGDPMPMPK